MREAVPRGELEQAPRVRRVARPDDPRADALADQQRPAAEERPEDDVAERRLGRDHRAEPGKRDDQSTTRRAGDAGEEGRLPRDRVELAEEAARAVLDDHTLVGAPGVVDDRDPAFEDDDEVDRRIAGTEQDLAGRERPLPPLAAEEASSCSSVRSGNAALRLPPAKSSCVISPLPSGSRRRRPVAAEGSAEGAEGARADRPGGADEGGLQPAGGIEVVTWSRRSAPRPRPPARPRRAGRVARRRPACRRRSDPARAARAPRPVRQG